MNMTLTVNSIRFRTGDWDHCFCCKPRNVKATHEVLVNDTSWIPVCHACLDVYKEHYDGEPKEWRKKGAPHGS